MLHALEKKIFLSDSYKINQKNVVFFFFLRNLSFGKVVNVILKSSVTFLSSTALFLHAVLLTNVHTKIYALILIEAVLI